MEVGLLNVSYGNFEIDLGEPSSMECDEPPVSDGDEKSANKRGDNIIEILGRDLEDLEAEKEDNTVVYETEYEEVGLLNTCETNAEKKTKSTNMDHKEKKEKDILILYRLILVSRR